MTVVDGGGGTACTAMRLGMFAVVVSCRKASGVGGSSSRGGGKTGIFGKVNSGTFAMFTCGCRVRSFGIGGGATRMRGKFNCGMLETAAG